ncbi:MAG: hypothetical protein M1820_004545 [Bogoriella megaspora]|nr:MAG: hypothetical protein M1820_004545 [Bogoriella megaspora]
MAPESTSPVPIEDSQPEDPNAEEPSSTSGPATVPRTRQSRRRTKTGCLTCRKRRIKCGEERPICSNCIKSKRHCEGYNQRVVFKPPNTDWRAPGSGASTLPYHTGSLPGTARTFQQHQPVQPPQSFPLTPLLPREPERPDYGLTGDPVSATSGHNAAIGSFFPYGTPGMDRGSSEQSPPLQYHQHSDHYSYSNVQTQFQSLGHPPPTPMSASVPNGAQREQNFDFVKPEDDFDAGFATAITFPEQDPTGTTGSTSRTLGVPSRDLLQEQKLVRPEWQRNIFDANNGDQPSYIQTQFQPLQPTHAQPQEQNVFPTPATPSQASFHANQSQSSPFKGVWYQPPPGVNASPTEDLAQAAIESVDDEYFDINSDDEIDIDPSHDSWTGNDAVQVGRALVAQNGSVDPLDVRWYDAFHYHGVLDSYRAEWVASPLKNPQTAQVFAHFVNVTGPGLSVFEGRTRNTSVLFREGPVPRYQQGLWTYTMPMMALHHQGLLHAMLAMSSIHIARMQRASTTPSYKHYAYSLRRVHHAVSHPQKRNQITTLAASLLLGFYEIMAADHSKWSSHLAGAKQLLNEFDFAGVHRELRKKKAERRAYEFLQAQQAGMRRPSYQWYGDEIPDVDENTVSRFMGREVRYDEYGHVLDEKYLKKTMPAEIDFGRFEVWQDLYWWYCKQDVYQSIVSGNPLLRDFHRWSDCPPRGPINSALMVVGSTDHMFLLLARVAAFAAKDRERKLKVLAANGGVWRPPQPPGSATTQVSHPATTPSGGQPGPPPGIPMPQMPFYGMAPPSTTRMPSSYTTQNQSPPPTPEHAHLRSPVFDAATSTREAIEEWTRINQALSSFPSYLGEHFQPFGPEYQPPMSTPFGESLSYSSFDIALMWAIYHMAHIILIRSHPHMPPASMIAQGIAAPQTAHHANEIGRIAAGIVHDPIPSPLNPALGAALTESTMPLFFAGVQYQDYKQREWLVLRIRSVEERTGWASAGLIANGCEKAWVKAYEAGRGPKWEPLMWDPHDQDERRHWTTGYRWEVDGRMIGAGLGRLVPLGQGRVGVDESVEDTDRRLVRTSEKARLHWAVGIIGMEEDVKRMSME